MIIENEMNKVNFGESRSKTKFGIGVPYYISPQTHVCKYNNSWESQYFIYEWQSKDIFTPGLMVSCRTHRKPSTDLIRAKLYPLERTEDSRNWN